MINNDQNLVPPQGQESASPEQETKTENVELERAYFRMIDRAAYNMEDSEIPNGSAAHARHLIMQLFNVAQQKVRLFSGSLDPSVSKGNIDVYQWPLLVASAIGFLKKQGTQLQILVEDEKHLENHPLLQFIESEGVQEKVKIRRLSDEIVQILKEKEKNKHFCLADKTSYREEQPDCHSATANFRAPEKTAELAELFDFMFDAPYSSTSRYQV